MLDVTAVGSNLTPEQQEETLSDLAYLLDEFGSTRAVRVKLSEQQREIQRLGGRLLNGRGVEEDEKNSTNEEIAVKKNQGGPNDVDEIMADVDFFLRVYGSTHAVRQELCTQKQRLADLRSAIRFFQKLQDGPATTENFCSTKTGKSDEMKVNCTTSATLVQQVAEKEQQNESITMFQHTQSATGRRRPSHVTCKFVGCMKWVMRHGESSDEYCAQHLAALASRDDCTDTSMQDEKSVRNEEDGGHKGDVTLEKKKRDNVPMKPKSGRLETFLHRGGANDDICVSGMIAAYYNQLKKPQTGVCGASKPPGASSSSDGSHCVELSSSQLKSTKVSFMTKQTKVIASIKTDMRTALQEPSSTRRSSHRCSHPGCTKNIQAHGLCWAHGGYYICKVDGCTRRAASRKLCRNHGGGTRCKLAECDSFSVSYGKGYCYRHAREQGLGVNRTSKTSTCHRPQMGNLQQDKGNGKNYPRPSTFEKTHQDSDEARTINIRRKARHETCKAFKCMKWVKRDGDQSEYCATHRNFRGSKIGKASTAPLIYPEHEVIPTEANPVKMITSKSHVSSCKGVEG
ncbi:hypothetical protein GN244_ATG13079 [Phytophthora infestans]|uniref:WRKY19-like zinc finger domain-containing protein n=1 Tax=Phytophthora infestans TaxID=4787 RepID=A0A833T0L0_PHYIN|nr:hypothetical protein GN244_ATG13079 [Phytophthora infestans]KAF4130627.1 hypothetical protein GN958_ATG20209 [Phytophthora infestans]